MKTIVIGSVLAILVASTAFSSDVQIPLDAQGNIPVIDRKLESAIGMFPRQAGFQEARLFRVSASEFSLEIYSARDGETVRERVSLSATEAEAFREKVSALVAERAPQANLDQSGRSQLVNTTRALALVQYGPGLPQVFRVEDGAPSIGIYGLTAGAGFFLPLWLTKNSRITEGQGEFAMYGGIHGLAHAALLNLVGTGKEVHFPTYYAIGIPLSLGELYGGYRLAGANDWSGGHARTMHVGSIFGTALGALAVYTVQGDGNDTRAYGVAGFAGSLGGLYAGHLIDGARTFSTGDATILALTGALGAYLPVALANAAHPNDDRVLAGTAIVGSIAGLWGGWRLTRDRDVATNPAWFIALGTATGELVGIGVCALSNDLDHPTAVLLDGAIGSVAGFALSWWMLADDESTPSTPIPVRISLNPSGLIPVPGTRPLPLITATASF